MLSYKEYPFTNACSGLYFFCTAVLIFLHHDPVFLANLKVGFRDCFAIVFVDNRQQPGEKLVKKEKVF